MPGAENPDIHASNIKLHSSLEEMGGGGGIHFNIRQLFNHQSFCAMKENIECVQ